MPSGNKNIIERAQEAWHSNPELDQTIAALQKAREELKDVSDNADLVARILERAKGPLNQELANLNVPADQQPQLAAAFETRFRVATTGLERDAIFRSLEGERLSAFINDYTKYTHLDAVIAECRKRDSKDPMKRFIRTIQANTPLLTGIGVGVMQWLNQGKKAGDQETQPSALETAAAKADEVLAGDQGKKDDKKTDVTTPASAASGSGNGNSSGGGSRRAAGGAPAPSPASGSARVESRGTVKYEINPDNSKKLSPEEFRKRYESITDRHARHMFVLQQVAAGNATNAFERLSIAGKKGSDLELEVEVDQGPLKVAGMEVEMDGPTGLAAAQLSGCVLPSRDVVDRIYEQARASNGMVAFVDFDQITKALNIPESQAYMYTVKNGVRTKHPNGTLMMSAQYAAKRDELVKKWCAEHNIKENQLRAGHFKEIIHPSAGRAAGMQSIYGGIKPDGKIIQNDEGPHEDTYSDYSGLVRRMRVEVWVKNKKTGERARMTFAEFSNNPQYAREFDLKPPRPGQAYALSSQLEQFVAQNQKKQKPQPNA
jgi:hypothetical protein